MSSSEMLSLAVQFLFHGAGKSPFYGKLRATLALGNTRTHRETRLSSNSFSVGRDSFIAIGITLFRAASE
jgi:hypothetical protein